MWYIVDSRILQRHSHRPLGKDKNQMTTTTYDPVAHMTALDCPHGCGAKLVADETFVGNATCVNDLPRTYSDDRDEDGYGASECNGYGVSYANSDEVCYAAYDIVKAEKEALNRIFNQMQELRWRQNRTEKRIARFQKLANRISDQHG